MEVIKTYESRCLAGILLVVLPTVMFGGAIDDPIYAPLGMPRSPVLDSNLRFFAGLWLGLGTALLWLIPTIERQAVLYRAIWGAVFLGGIGRLLSIAFVGLPPVSFLAFTALEIIGAPLFIYWQAQISRSGRDLLAR